MLAFTELFIILSVFFSSLTVIVEGSVNGWFVSETTTAKEVNCFVKKNNARYIIYSGMYQNKMSEDICDNLKAASVGGIPFRDVKFGPCPTCSASAAAQMEAMVSYINTNCEAGTWTRRIWLDTDNSQVWNTPWRDIGRVY
jgi:hypothetical protein